MTTSSGHKTRAQCGYILLSVMLLVALMLLTLSIEAPRIAQQIKREKEEELIHRGNEYKNAIKKFFRKFGRYPLSIEQLENTNNIRFLRRRYKDPFTGKDDWRLLHPGEVQLSLTNPATGAPGQPTGQSISTIGQPASFGTNSPTPSPSPSPNPAQTDPNQNAGGTSATGAPGSQAGGTTGGFSLGGPNSTGAQPGMGPIIGVSSTSKLQSIKEINGKNHYNDWQFVYDPRLEQQNLPPGAPGTTGINPIGGSTPGQTNPPGQINPPNQTNPPPPGPRPPQ